MAFLITSLAGFSTLLGMIPILFPIQKKDRLINFCLSFSAGVMITVSVIDLIPESLSYLQNIYSTFPSILISSIFIVIGILFSSFIDQRLDSKTNRENKLYKLGIISMLAIIMHNIPEGIATFISYQENASLGITLAIAIALHNIPEGISIAIPLYYSTKKKTKAFLYTLISALSEPLGALLSFWFLSSLITPHMMGILLAMIAGIMIHISCYELLPNAFSYQNKKTSIRAFLLGFFIMFSCVLLLH